MDYDSMSRADLVEACRSRGLPTYGNKDALASRLRDGETGGGREEVAPTVAAGPPPAEPEDDLAELLGDSAVVVTAEPDEPERAGAPAPVAPPAPAEQPAPDRSLPPGVFHARFPAPDELDDNIHHQMQLDTRQAAIDAGYQPRGGLYGARRVGPGPYVDGRPTVVYEILVRQ